MSSTNVTPQPLWQRFLSNQRVKALLINALTASGAASLPFVHKWFPALTPGDIADYIIGGVPFVVVTVIDWYRNHPDNILARARKVINGGTASPAAVAETAAVADAHS
jgi:hypothetical protein